MKRKRPVAFLCYLIVLQFLFSLSVLAINGAVSVGLRVEQVVWGTSTDDPITVSPGDVNVPLTVIVRNLANDKTIKGIYAKLGLAYPFRSYSGGLVATSTGEPRETKYLEPTEEVLPAGSFILTFRLDIDQDAKPANYQYTMTVEYKVKQTGSTYTDGVPQQLKVNLFLQSRAPVIDSFTPVETDPILYVGDDLNFSCKSHDPDGDALTFVWLVDDENVSNSSFFLYTPTIQDVGTHTVELRVDDGSLTTSQIWNLQVEKLKTTQILVPENFIVGGFKTRLNITLGNNLWKGIVQVDFTAAQPGATQPTPMQPLIIYGNNSWIFFSINSSDFISVYPEVYAPSSSIGTTYMTTLTVTYKDEYGRSYTDTISVGLIVRGMARLIVYDVEVTPNPVRSGSTVTITATLLNKGNIKVSNINTSIQSNSILELSSASRYYIDEIEQSSPEPFSVRATVNPDVQNGTYPVNLSVSYQDDQYVDHSLDLTAYLVVEKIKGGGTTSDSTGGFLGLGPLSEVGLVSLTLLGASIAVVLLYRRRVGIQQKSEGLPPKED